MSRDKRRVVEVEGADPSQGTLITSAKVEEPKKTVEDSTDTVSEAPVRVRRKSRNQGAKGPLAGYDRYIPKGWRGRFVNPSNNRPQVLYDRDYEFATDENGSRIYVAMNSGSEGDKNKYVLMMIREEDIAENDREREAE